MHDEKSVFAWEGRIWIAHNGRGDIRWEYRPLTERLNPLRYEVGLRWPHRNAPVRWCINRNGKWHRAFSNLTWRLWRKRRWERSRSADDGA